MMVSRRKILSRSRDQLNVDPNFQVISTNSYSNRKRLGGPFSVKFATTKIMQFFALNNTIFVKKNPYFVKKNSDKYNFLLKRNPAFFC